MASPTTRIQLPETSFSWLKLGSLAQLPPRWPQRIASTNAVIHIVICYQQPSALTIRDSTSFLLIIRQGCLTTTYHEYTQVFNFQQFQKFPKTFLPSAYGNSKSNASFSLQFGSSSRTPKCWPPHQSIQHWLHIHSASDSAQSVIPCK